MQLQQSIPSREPEPDGDRWRRSDRPSGVTSGQLVHGGGEEDDAAVAQELLRRGRRAPTHPVGQLGGLPRDERERITGNSCIY